MKRAAMLALVDSCGWLEYMAGGGNAGFFEAALLDTQHLIVPTICIYEVGKRMLMTQGESAAQEVLEMMQQGRVVQLDTQGMWAAAKTSAQHGLAMADAIIWQLSQTHNAALYTQDKGLMDMPGVRFQSKTQAPITRRAP